MDLGEDEKSWLRRLDLVEGLVEEEDGGMAESLTEGEFEGRRGIAGNNQEITVRCKGRPGAVDAHLTMEAGTRRRFPCLSDVSVLSHPNLNYLATQIDGRSSGRRDFGTDWFNDNYLFEPSVKRKLVDSRWRRKTEKEASSCRGARTYPRWTSTPSNPNQCRF